MATVAKALGATKTVVIPQAAAARSAAYVITAIEGGQLHLPRLRTRPQDFDPDTRERFMAGALLPGAWYVKAQRFRRHYRAQVQKLFEEVDIILAPATPCTAPKLGQVMMKLGGVELPVRANLGLFTQPISFIGLPVVVAPLQQPGRPADRRADHRQPLQRSGGALRVAPPSREAGRRQRAAGAEALSRSERSWTSTFPRSWPRSRRPSSATRRRSTATTSATLDELFWKSPHTLRYGVGEQLYGYDQIAAFRAGRDPGFVLNRDLLKVWIVTYGRDFGTANCEFRRHGGNRTGRQSHTWMRTPEGWRIVAAHVSLLGEATVMKRL